jgi:hypothetical protein
MTQKIEVDASALIGSIAVACLVFMLVVGFTAASCREEGRWQERDAMKFYSGRGAGR